MLLVARSNAGWALADFIEAYLETARRPDVDVLCDASAINVVPDTAADFVALMLSRVVAAYGKPIFRGAGNTSLRFSSASANGEIFSVGGTLGPQTFEAFYGGAALPGLIVHPTGAAGPALDGGVKPDFLAPMHVIAADTPASAQDIGVPSAAPTAKLPPGHQISCCTSASSPYAAGVAALLISRARLEGVTYTFPMLARALRLGTRFLPGTPSYQQGNGVMDVEAAWRELSTATEGPRITASARIVTPLAMSAAHGEVGSAIFERDGWFARQKGRSSADTSSRDRSARAGRLQGALDGE